MGTITYQVPVAGSEQNATADPKIATALQALLTLVNGQIDTNNLSPTANIAFSQIAYGAWVSLTLSTGVTSASGGGGYTPAVRVEGTVARLCGILLNSSGSTIPAGNTIFTVPAAAKPAANVNFSSVQGGGGTAGAVIEAISTGGNASLSSAGPGWIAGDIISLDGLSYRLS